VIKEVLVVGSGSWATRINGMLSERYGFTVQQVSARKFVNELAELTMLEKKDLCVSATSPELQEQVQPLLARHSKYLWLEKPVSQSFESGKKMIVDIKSQENCYALVNFSWLLSSVWEKFESLNNTINDVSMIEIRQSAKERSHSYMSIIEDYGSHDIALMNKWIFSEENPASKIVLENFSECEFEAKREDTRILWKINFGVIERSMTWLITWNNGSQTFIDFYGGKIIHNNSEVIVPYKDNIDSFVAALLAKNDSVANTNHKIALMTKEFFSVYE